LQSLEYGMKRILISLLAILAIQSSLSAGNITREEQFNSFTGISVSDKFNVSIVDGSSMKVSLTVEEVLADFVHMTIIDGILTITFDEKSMTKEIRASIKQRDPKTIRMDVEIAIPSTCPLKSISLSDHAVLSSKADMSPVESFSLDASGNSVVKALSVKSKDATITASKHAEVKASFDCDKTIISGAGNCILDISASGKEAKIEAQSASMVNFTSAVDLLVVNSAGSSKIAISGTANKIEVNGKNSSCVDASGLSVRTSRLNMTSSYCEINAKDTLYLNLNSGAKLNFAGAPVLEVVKVEKSSIYKKQAAQ